MAISVQDINALNPRSTHAALRALNTLPGTNPHQTLYERCQSLNMDHDALEILIEVGRKQQQIHADKVDPDYLKLDGSGKPTFNNLLIIFSNEELTRLAYKMRLDRSYASRIYIAQRIAEIAKANDMKIVQLTAILNRKTRLRKELPA